MTEMEAGVMVLSIFLGTTTSFVAGLFCGVLLGRERIRDLEKLLHKALQVQR